MKFRLVLQLLAVFGSSCEVASQPDRLRSNQITFQIASLSSKGQDYSDADNNNNKAINTIYMNIYPKYTRLFFFSLQSLSFRETCATNILFMCNSGVHSDTEGVCTVCSGQIPPPFLSHSSLIDATPLRIISSLLSPSSIHGVDNICDSADRLGDSGILT